MLQSETRKIIHIDMDAFYASVEQRDDPVLRGRPVAVGGSRLRGVVAAASYEARQFGVRSAMPSVTALRHCPELIFVKPRFEVYKAISKQIRAIFAEYTPLIEPLSLDEAYLDVTCNLKNMPSAAAIAAEIRARIYDEVTLTASAGVSYNKFLAKIASTYRKPNGQFVVIPAKGLEFIEELGIAKFHGVGPVTAAKMNRLGIFTGADLRCQTTAFLQQHFGKAGLYYHAIAHGRDDRPVMPGRPRKSLGAETTFANDLNQQEEIEAGIMAMLDKVCIACDASAISGRTLTVKIKYADFQIVTRSHSTLTLMNKRSDLERASLDLVRGIFPLEKPIRLLGVSLSNFETSDRPAPSQLAFAL